MKLTVTDAKGFAKALALVASLTPRRASVEALYYVHVAAAGDAVTLSATDLDASLAVTVPAAVEVEGTGLFIARELADAMRKLDKGAHCSIERVDGDEAATIYAGRSRFNVNGRDPAEFPLALLQPFDDSAAWTAVAETAGEHNAEGVQLSDDAAKVLAKALKYAKPCTVDCARRDDENGNGERYAVEFGNVRFVAELAEPALAPWKPSRRSKYTYGHDSAAALEAVEYLRTLRLAHGLPDVVTDDSAPVYTRERYPVDAKGSLVEVAGYAVGLTVGESWRDEKETRPCPDGFTLPDGAEPEIAGCIAQIEIDGVEYVRLGDGPWEYRYVPERAGAIRYADGSYSVPLPVAQRRAIAAVTVDVDGERQPLRVHETTGGLELTADQVRALCGPVDPSTFVPIPAVAFHHGRVIATGDAAERFNAMQAEFDRNARKALKNCRSTADKFLTAANIGASWSAKVERFLERDGDTSAPVPAAVVPALPVPIALLPAPAAVEAAPDPAPAVVEVEDPRAVEPVEVALLAANYPPISGQLAVEDRLARIETHLGLAPAARRSPRHAAAIQRAWNLRRALRREREGRELYARLYGERVEAHGLVERQLADVGRDRQAERAEHVAEIDALRDSLAKAERLVRQYGHDVPLLSAEVETLRRDLSRTQAERDGIAGNLAAMTSRCLALESAVPAAAGPRRFILSSKLEA